MTKKLKTIIFSKSLCSNRVAIRLLALPVPTRHKRTFIVSSTRKKFAVKQVEKRIESKDVQINHTGQLLSPIYLLAHTGLSGICPRRQHLGHFIDPLCHRFIVRRFSHRRANASSSRVFIPGIHDDCLRVAVFGMPCHEI